MIGVIILKTLVWGDPVPGWPSLACIVLLVGGIQLFCMGILGEYLSKAYMETKRRPKFIIRESGLRSDVRPKKNKELYHHDHIIY